MALDPESLRICNCACCERELLGSEYAHQERRWGYQLVAGRVNGRPYCFDCLHPPSPRSGRTTDEPMRTEL